MSVRYYLDYFFAVTTFSLCYFLFTFQRTCKQFFTFSNDLPITTHCSPCSRWSHLFCTTINSCLLPLRVHCFGANFGRPAYAFFYWEWNIDEESWFIYLPGIINWSITLAVLWRRWTVLWDRRICLFKTVCFVGGIYKDGMNNDFGSEVGGCLSIVAYFDLP